MAGWRARVAVESPSHLRNDHPGEVRWTLMAAYLLIATVHRINARAETRTREHPALDGQPGVIPGW